MFRRSAKAASKFKAPAAKPPASAPPATLQAERDAIAKNPADLNNIAALGAKQTGALDGLTKRMLKVQGDFSNAVNDMTGALQRLEGEIRTLDIGNLSGVGSKLSESYQPLIDSLITAEAQKKAAQDIARERIDITQDLRYYIAAGPSILDDYRSRHIPSATGPAGKATLEKRVEDLTVRLAVIEGTRAASAIAGLQLKQLLETMDDMIENLKPMLSEVKDVYQSAKLDYEQKEAARNLAEAIETFTQGTSAPVTVKKPLQFKPKL